MSHTIKELAFCERPYEKAMALGINKLSDSELLAIILRNGTKNSSSIDLANQILNLHHSYKGIQGLNYLSRSDLLKVSGIGDTKATLILAVAEFSKRINITKRKKLLSLRNPNDVASYYIEKCRYHTKEHVYLAMFSNSHELIKDLELSKGTINFALISVRDIIIEALRYDAISIILVHNHPSGSPEPSKEDIEVTRKLKEACILVELHLDDHIVIGNDCYVSLLERGII